eukprot:scaffold36594_cov22-Tisochrysis_lutea.AAC.1
MDLDYDQIMREEDTLARSITRVLTFRRCNNGRGPQGAAKKGRGVRSCRESFASDQATMRTSNIRTVHVEGLKTSSSWQSFPHI